ncbi:MAG: ABC transporter ATP-binding protein/permease [Roseococcus sp.]
MLHARPPEAPLRAFWHLTLLWLRAEDRVGSRLLLLCLSALTIAQVLLQVRLNVWSRDFFNALEQRDSTAFATQILLFLGLAAVSMAVAVYQLYVKNRIQLRWRGWLTHHLLGAWLRDGRAYQLEMVGGAADNPDQRIAEDVRIATDLAVEFAAGLLNSLLLLSCFIGILWTLSGALQFAMHGHDFVLPGYMVWAALGYAALGYAALGSLLTGWVGRSMVRLNIRRTTAEADFRFGLTRARESGEGIALIRGEADERRGLSLLFGDVAGSVLALMRSQRNLMWLTSAYGTLALIFPTIVASPAYFAGMLTLGGLMQIGAAFGQVQGALNWFVQNFGGIAEWRGAITRIITLRDVIEELDDLLADPEQPTINIVEAAGGEGAEPCLAFRNLEVAFANGTAVIADASAEIAAGERVLLEGASGTGKSTLFRAIAGLWPWGAGEIFTPPRASMMFLPQRPYLPRGALMAVLAYPGEVGRFTRDECATALMRVGLAGMTDQLDRVERWDRVLNLGEQQRAAIARLLLHAPGWIFMDEATTGLDEAAQDDLMRLVIEALPASALISIGHRSGLAAFHNRTITLRRAEGGARLAPSRRARRPIAA